MVIVVIVYSCILYCYCCHNIVFVCIGHCHCSSLCIVIHLYFVLSLFIVIIVHCYFCLLFVVIVMYCIVHYCSSLLPLFFVVTLTYGEPTVASQCICASFEISQIQLRSTRYTIPPPVLYRHLSLGPQDSNPVYLCQ